MNKKIKKIIIGIVTFSVLSSSTYKIVKENNYTKIINKHNQENNHVENIVAHRGFSMFYPDNSYESVEAAINSNCTDLIEIDIRLTKDKELVLHHDSVINISDKTLIIEDLFYNELKDNLISFKEFLNWYSWDKPLIIDVKTNDINYDIIYLLNYLINNYQELVFIQSESDKFLNEMMNLFPNYKYLYVINTKSDLNNLNSSFYGYTVRYGLFKKINLEDNKMYLVYTINSKNKYNKLLENNNYKDNIYIITDNPDYICSLNKIKRK